MAKGNFKPEVIKPSTKCKICGYKISGLDFVRIDGIRPAHRDCATVKNYKYTIGAEVRIDK